MWRAENENPEIRYVLSQPLVGCFEARIVGEFKSNAAWFPHHEMDLRSFTGERRSEFHDDVRPTRDPLVQRIQPWAISHGQREVMQADIGAPVKRDGRCRRLDLPQGDDQAAVGDEDGGIVRPLTDNIPPEALAKEAAGAFKVSDAQSDMIDADCGRGGIGHRELSFTDQQNDGFAQAAS